MRSTTGTRSPRHWRRGRPAYDNPHPRFCCNDQYVVFTTRVRGEIDVAVVPTAELLKHTS